MGFIFGIPGDVKTFKYNSCEHNSKLHGPTAVLLSNNLITISGTSKENKLPNVLKDLGAAALGMGI